MVCRGGAIPRADCEYRWQRAQCEMCAACQCFQHCETAQECVGSSSARSLTQGRAANIAAGLPLDGGTPRGGADQIGSRRSCSAPSVSSRCRSRAVRRLRSRRCSWATFQTTPPRARARIRSEELARPRPRERDRPRPGRRVAAARRAQGRRRATREWRPRGRASHSNGMGNRYTATHACIAAHATRRRERETA